MAGYAGPHSTHRNTIAGGLSKSSFDDWQRTAFQSVVGAPSHLFSQGLQGLTAVAEKRTNIFARHGRGPEPDREGTARYASFMLFGQDLGPRTSREHKFAFDELLSFIGPAIRSEKWAIFWNTLPPARKPDNAAGSNTVASER